MISGIAKGHKLKTLKGDATRPTSDKVKESLFNIIASYIPGAEVLDLYAGTGNLGIEALSRGAVSAVFVDNSRESCRIIKENLEHTKMQDKGIVYHGSVQSIISKLAAQNKMYDIIFMDPPYKKNFIVETLNILANNDIIKKNGILIAEHSILDVVPEDSGKLRLVSSRRYRETVLSFYKPVI